MKKGIELHTEYSLPYQSFDRRLLRYNLDLISTVFERTYNDITVRGIPDDYRVISDSDSRKSVSIIEVKTTSKDFLFSYEYEAAIFQVRLYAWIMEPVLAKLGFQLHDRMYVEVYSQKDNHLIKRIPVTPYSTSEMESLLSNIKEEWIGLRPMHYPTEWKCKTCPVQVKNVCDRWLDTHGDNRRILYATHWI
jgi:CRISPR/Cas system-associated exonuclease Cas4 (RecB family)